jgi:hypothetical protein
MSNAKITPKNLSYDNTLPPFLQRIQANNISSSDGRHERAIARPKRVRTKEDEEDDAPLIVDERGWVVEVDGEATADGEKNVVEAGQTNGGSGLIAEGEPQEAAKEKVAAIGGARKRKVGKIVGGGDGEEDETSASKPKMPKTTDGSKTLGIPKDGTDIKAKPSGKKKGKKIMLSFGDDE